MRRHASSHLETAFEQVAPTRAQWEAWGQTEPSLAGLSYRELRRELRTGGQDRRDQLLGALVRVSQHDPDAFVVLAACLLPALRSRVRQYGRSLDHDDALSVMVVALYETVDRYDVRQPRFVPTSLLTLPTGRLRRAAALEVTWTRRRCHDVVVDMQDEVAELSAVTMLTEAVDAGVLAPEDAELIFDTRIVGHSLAETARRLRLGHEAVKKRRQRAEARWSQWWSGNRSLVAPGRHAASATKDAP